MKPPGGDQVNAQAQAREGDKASHAAAKEAIREAQRELLRPPVEA
jgi:hypothetical protein